MKIIIKKIIVFNILFLCISSFLFGKDIEFNLQAPKFVKQGERFKITIQANEKPESTITLPEIDNTRLLFGPSSSTSISSQWINGKSTVSKSYAFSYILLAEKIGKTTIPAISTTIDGKTYKTASTSLEIIKNDSPTPAQQGQPQRANNNRRQRQIATPTSSKSNNFFVKVQLSKKTVYPNQHIVATLKLYTRYNGISDVNISAPSFKGFISKEIPNSSQGQFVQENINGTIYNTIVISKYLLFPTKAGKLKIDDFKISALAQQRVRASRDIFEDFFGQNIRQMQVEAVNPAVTVNVKPLPSNAPTGYKGAVGNFKMHSSLASDSVSINEATTLKIKIKGNGNLQMLKAPKLELSSDLEVYDPKNNNNTGITDGGMNGTTSYEYLIIPRHSGVYEIPKITFSYFSTLTNKYETIHTQPYTLRVGGNNTDSTNSTTPAISRYQNTRKDVANLGNDIKYIKTKTPRLKAKGYYFYNSILFWIILFGMPLLFVFFLILNTRKNSDNSTLEGKSKKASKVATKRLRIAKKSLQNNEKEAFYNHTLEALWGFVSQKLQLPLSQLNKDNITELLNNRKVDETITHEYLDILNECEMAQYTPTSNVNMKNNYNRALSIITKLEQKL